MRNMFIEAKSRYMAMKKCPWAETFAKVYGGYWAFESYQDYKIWRNQK